MTEYDEFQTKLVLSPEEWERFIDMLNNPPEPTQELIDLMRRAHNAEATILDLHKEIERLTSQCQTWDREMLFENGRLHADNKRLRSALFEMIEITKRNSNAELMLLGIRRCAEDALAQGKG